MWDHGIHDEEGGMTIDTMNARAIVERLRYSSAQCPCDGCRTKKAAADLIESLLAERDALARDAARYRWLRELPWPDSSAVCKRSPDEMDVELDAMRGARND